MEAILFYLLAAVTLIGTLCTGQAYLPALAFMAFPEAISRLPMLRELFGALFFLSLLLAGVFGEMIHVYNPVEYRTILANAVTQFATLPARIEGQLGDVEVVVRKQPGRLLVHLVNYLGIPPRPYERVCPQQGIRLRISGAKVPKSVRALRAGTDCQWTVEGNDLIIRLPVLNDFEAVAVE